MLGPDDQVTIRVLNLDEIPTEPFRIDLRGNINVPLAGRIHAAGLTVEQLEAELARRLKSELRKPIVTVSVTEFHNEPVSVLGAVLTPGVHQIRGRKALFEVLSAAGGLKPEAGNTVHITRQKESGPLPLPTARLDSTGEFYVAELKVKSVMEATNPEENIVVMPNDVISVPKGELVYVIGAVHRSGGFVLNEKENISMLEALSLAEGLDKAAAPGCTKILRAAGPQTPRVQVPVNLKKILSGQSPDVPLAANDILFVPTSAPKSAGTRAVEAAISLGTGILIYRR
jgi:polysaccharide export outer membrane protein